MGYDLLGMGAMPPVLTKITKSQVLDAIKNKMSGVTTEVRAGLRAAYYNIGKWIALNPKKATGVAILSAAGLVTAGNLMYDAFSTDDEMKKAGLLGKADEEVDGSILKAGTLATKLQEQAAEVISKASEGDMSGVEGGMEWWHWGLIVGGGVAAIFLVWFMFRGKRGGKRRRRR